jgi:hypothetical protein
MAGMNASSANTFIAASFTLDLTNRRGTKDDDVDYL